MVVDKNFVNKSCRELKTLLGGKINSGFILDLQGDFFQMETPIF